MFSQTYRGLSGDISGNQSGYPQTSPGKAGPEYWAEVHTPDITVGPEKVGVQVRPHPP